MKKIRRVLNNDIATTLLECEFELGGGVETRSNTELCRFHLSIGELVRNFSFPTADAVRGTARTQFSSPTGEVGRGTARRKETNLAQNHPVTASAEGAWQSRCYTNKYLDGLLCLLTSLDLGRIKVRAIPKGGSPC